MVDSIRLIDSGLAVEEWRAMARKVVWFILVG